jgi:hypothetical protein
VWPARVRSCSVQYACTTSATCRHYSAACCRWGSQSELGASWVASKHMTGHASKAYLLRSGLALGELQPNTVLPSG